jgi:hypothetical protein
MYFQLTIFFKNHISMVGADFPLMSAEKMIKAVNRFRNRNVIWGNYVVATDERCEKYKKNVNAVCNICAIE